MKAPGNFCWSSLKSPNVSGFCLQAINFCYRRNEKTSDGYTTLRSSRVDKKFGREQRSAVVPDAEDHRKENQDKRGKYKFRLGFEKSITAERKNYLSVLTESKKSRIDQQTAQQKQYYWTVHCYQNWWM